MLLGPKLHYPSTQIKILITITLTRHRLKGFKHFDILCSVFSLNNEHASLQNFSERSATIFFAEEDKKNKLPL